MEEISVVRLQLGSLFRCTYVANFLLFAPLGLFAGIGAAAGGTGVEVNGQAVHGVAAVPVALLLVAIAALIPAAWTTMTTALLRILKGRGPKLRLYPPHLV